jgi:hypothetical protein
MGEVQKKITDLEGELTARVQVIAVPGEGPSPGVV